jgi:hypothetical protein
MKKATEHLTDYEHEYWPLPPTWKVFVWVVVILTAAGLLWVWDKIRY